jgi:putative transposase
VPALPIRQDLPAAELRRLARREPDRRAAMRLLAIANALDGFSRAEAARLAGMERQALRDAVLRYNAEGPSGLHDRPRPGRPEGLTPGQQAALKAWVLRGPAPERDGVSAWRLVDICARAEEAYGVRYRGWGMSRLLGRLGLSRQKARPRHPQGGSAAARAAFEKGAWADARRDRPSPPGGSAAALVRGRGPGRPERPDLPSLVRARDAPAGARR